MESEIHKAYRIADLILRYRENTLSSAEAEELEYWLAMSPEHRQQLEVLIDREFLQRKYQQELSIDTAAAYSAFFKRIAEKRSRKFGKWYIRATVAALCLIAWGVYWCWPEAAHPGFSVQNSIIPAGCNEAILTLANGEQLHLQESTLTSIRQDDGSVANVSTASLEYEADTSLCEVPLYNSLYIPRKGEFTLVLSDGTRIWLNSESMVEYPTSFLPGQRKIRLRGEAYFQVAPDRKSPFIIESGEVQIQVLGTSFNLRAYEDEKVVQTTLVKGSVCMSSGKEQMILVPDEQGCVDTETGNMVKKRVDVQVYTGWKDGRFVFEHQTLEEIMKTLARWYDVEVVFQSEKARNIEFIGNLKRYADFGQIISMLELACPVKFTVSGTAIHISE